jgi:RNA polymerase sigma-70 factor (ECF subfamily)
VFIPFLAERTSGNPSELFTSDLFLACACAQQDPVAIQLFEREFIRDVHAKLSQLGGSSAFAEDVGQVLMQTLFIPDANGRLKISAYSGAGPLKTWVYAVAMRKAMRMKRKAQREESAPSDELFQAIAIWGDLELELIHARHREQFRAAVSEAVRMLSSRDRNVLRMHHLAGMTLDRVAAIYGVHRATVARWLARSRARILDQTRQSLTTHLKLNESELESFLRVIRSQLDASLVRLLKRVGSGSSGFSSSPVPPSTINERSL